MRKALRLLTLTLLYRALSRICEHKYFPTPNLSLFPLERRHCRIGSRVPNLLSNSALYSLIARTTCGYKRGLVNSEARTCADFSAKPALVAASRMVIMPSLDTNSFTNNSCLRVKRFSSSFTFGPVLRLNSLFGNLVAGLPSNECAHRSERETILFISHRNKQ